jgi:hypothetical protein
MYGFSTQLTGKLEDVEQKLISALKVEGLLMHFCLHLLRKMDRLTPLFDASFCLGFFVVTGWRNVITGRHQGAHEMVQASGSTPEARPCKINIIMRIENNE